MLDTRDRMRYKETMTTTQTITATDRQIARAEQQLRELAQNLSHLVESGDLTEHEANEWLASTQDRLLGGDY